MTSLGSRGCPPANERAAPAAARTTFAAQTTNRARASPWYDGPNGSPLAASVAPPRPLVYGSLLQMMVRDSGSTVPAAAAKSSAVTSLAPRSTAF